MAALLAAVFPLSAKNRRGGHFLPPPPPPVRVLSRRFDVIDHELLLNKLKMLQISTGWFRSFLSDHTQNVRVGENVSCSLPISIGTFQGTCLGPLLFNIATNDFDSYIPKEFDGFRITTVRYADDSQIAITGPRKSMSEMRIALEKILDVVDT